MATLNILLVSSKLSPEYSGGGFRVINMYLRLMQKAPIKIDAFCGSEEFYGDGSYYLDKIKVRRFNSRIIPYGSILNEDNAVLKKIKFSLKVVFELARMLFNIPFNKYDIVHVVGRNYISSAAIVLAYFFRKPLIIEYVTDSSDFTFSHEPGIIRAVIKDRPYKSRRTILVAISPLIEEALKKYGLTNIWMRPNPIDEDKFRFYTFKEKYSLRNRLTKFSKDDIVLSYIGKWRPSKNHIFLLRLMALLPDKFKLIMGGPLVSDGPYYQRDLDLVTLAKTIIKDYKLDSRVIILDSFVNNIAELIGLSDLYLMPTKEEALGTPLLEAVAVGRPVVANNLPKVWGWLAQDFPSILLTSLQEENWITSINAAILISEDKLKEYSEGILDLASSSIIDQNYILLMEKLKRQHSKLTDECTLGLVNSK